MVATFGIVNLTHDSFSDGGRFVAGGAGLDHAKALLAAGADVIDLGAESTHPAAADVADEEQIRRLEPVVMALVERGARVSIDTWRPGVMAAFVDRGIAWLNCVHGFRTPGALDVAAAAPAHVRFVVMFQRGDGARASGDGGDEGDILAQLRSYFRDRIRAFADHGIGIERLVLDPGMGFFLGATAAPSLAVLRRLDELADLGAERMISVSRKSLIGEVTGRAVAERGPGTLATELWAARRGVEWIRTHDVGALRDGLLMEQALDR